MSGHKIEDYTFSLYNVRFAGEDEYRECHSLMCGGGSCICIDGEQTGLLRKLLSEEDHLVMSFAGERAYFPNMQNSLPKEDICMQSVINQEKADCYDVFFRNKFSSEDADTVEKLIETYGGSMDLMDAIKSVSILYTTNSLHKFKERNSLVYLCKYAPCADRCISVLLRAVICRTIGCCQRAETQREKDEYVENLAALLNNLKTVLHQSESQMADYCIGDVDIYIEAWNRLDFGEDVPEVHLISKELESFREELENVADGSENVKEAGKHQKLYGVLKKILATAGISIESLPNLPFTDFEDVQTDYDEVMDILGQVKNDAARQKKIWEILFQIFWEGEDIPTDEMDEMRLLAAS